VQRVNDPHLTRGFNSPEDAALADFHAGCARVVRVEYSDANHARVDLVTNEDPYVYPYHVECIQVGGRWYELSGYN
jgi:hypothetical protein